MKRLVLALALLLAISGRTSSSAWSVRAPTLIVLGDQDIVKPEHAIELTRLIFGSRLLILPGGHGDYLGEAVMTQTDSRYPELTVALIEEFLDSE